jgi:hypothetical protein
MSRGFLGAEGHAMSVFSQALKIAAIANAVLLVALFVGCPARNRTDIVPPTISTPTGDFQRHVPQQDERFMPPSISPVIGDYQRHMPAAKGPPQKDERFMPPSISPPPVDFKQLLPPGGIAPPPPPPASSEQPGPR